ncbi:hypothetical protein [Streptomyces sp. NPDC048142]|uniref:hypothetical protein n=1 Tax=Streptomyces sp. NPDC048142 TaxID=3365501 RepID=UPI003717D52C
MTEWPELGQLDWIEAHSVMWTPVMFDGRNLLVALRYARPWRLAVQDGLYADGLVAGDLCSDIRTAF